MFTGHDRDRLARIDRNDEGWRKVRREVDLAAGKRKGGDCSGLGYHIADVGKALGPQQLLSEILGRNADAGDFSNSDCRGFQPFVLSLQTRRPDEAGGAGGREGGKEAASTLRHLRHVTSSSKLGKPCSCIRPFAHEGWNSGTKIAWYRQVDHPSQAI